MSEHDMAGIGGIIAAIGGPLLFVMIGLLIYSSRRRSDKQIALLQQIVDQQRNAGALSEHQRLPPV